MTGVRHQSAAERRETFSSRVRRCRVSCMLMSFLKEPILTAALGGALRGTVICIWEGDMLFIAEGLR